jgi:hypothetical protein
LKHLALGAHTLYTTRLKLAKIISRSTRLLTVCRRI